MKNTLPKMSSVGTGPQKRLSALLAELSPSVKQCLSGTTNVSPGDAK